MKKVIISEILEWCKKEGYSIDYFGKKDIEIYSFSSLNCYKEGTLTWINIKNPVDKKVLPMIRCAVIQKGVTDLTENCIVSENSKKLFFSILKHFFSDNIKGITERKNSYIGGDVKLGKNVKIGCNCVLDGEILIGDDTVIEHNVIITNRVDIGTDCIIHSGTVIGKDGFGFSFDDYNVPQKVSHFGGVKIGNRVEIGCNCAIDRGTIDDTYIGDDVKIDSLVVVGHNVIIENGALVIAAAVLCGSSEVGTKSYIAPCSVVKNHTKVGSNSFISLGAIVDKSVPDDTMLLMNKQVNVDNYRRFL